MCVCHPYYSVLVHVILVTHLYWASGLQPYILHAHSYLLAEWIHITDCSISEWTCGGCWQVTTIWSKNRLTKTGLELSYNYFYIMSTGSLTISTNRMDGIHWWWHLKLDMWGWLTSYYNMEQKQTYNLRCIKFLIPVICATYINKGHGTIWIYYMKFVWASEVQFWVVTYTYVSSELHLYNM